MYQSQDDLQLALKGLLADEYDLTANSANLCALIYHELADLNWVGFYWLKDHELVLGAFQGRPACVRIALGQGVCGAAAATRTTQVVADVHEFPGHIACDAASQSELVIPLLARDELLGVLDLDSPIKNRFDDATVDLVSQLARDWCTHQFCSPETHKDDV